MAEEEVEIVGLKETLRAFRRLPKEASAALRERSQGLAEVLARKAEAAGRASSPQSALVAGATKARKDRIPKIAAGGAKRVGRNRAPLHKILFGAEFGSGRLKQFRPHTGRTGYWLFSTVEREKAAVAKAYQDVLDDVAKEFTRDDVGGI